MSCRHCNVSGHRERGAALVVALLVFAICTALIVAMKSRFERTYARSASIFQGEQAWTYLRGAEALAVLALQADYDEDQQSGQSRDDLQEIWAQPSTPYALDEGGWLKGSLQDLQGRFNLNSLSARALRNGDTPRYSAAQQQFIRLLQALDEPQLSEPEAIAIVQSVSDWLDSNRTPLPDGAEDDVYLSRTPAYRAANRPLATISELRAVANVTPQLYRALAPLVTVWPVEPEPLNIHTAAMPVLRSINADGDLQPLSPSEGEALLAARTDGGFTSLDDFLALPVFADRRSRMTDIRALLGETSSCFLLQAEVEVADRNMHLYSVLRRQGRHLSVLTRTTGSL